MTTAFRFTSLVDVTRGPQSMRARAKGAVAMAIHPVPWTRFQLEGQRSRQRTVHVRIPMRGGY
jgi:hypothetical protein